MSSSMTWEEFSLADLAPLQDLAASWTAHASAMLEQAERVTADVVGGPLSADNFDSATAEECREQLGRLADQFLDDIHDYASVRIGATLDMLYESLDAQQQNLKDVIDEVVSEQFVIVGGAGSEQVELTQRLEDELNATADPLTAIADAQHRARGLQSLLREIMERARAADEEAAAVLDALKSEAVDLPPFLGAGYEDAVEAYEEALAEHEAAQREEMLSGEADPHAVAGWWASLSEEERADLVADERDAIRGLDGIPSAVRHDANMDYLAEYVEANPGDADAAALLEQVRSEGLMLLGFEPATDRQAPHGAPSSDWSVIVATGDPDAADNVGIYIPGTGSDTTLDGSSLKAGTGAYIDYAGNIQSAADRADPGADNVTVMWLGSDMPDTLLDAAGGSYAERAGAALDGYTNGVNATNTNGSGANVTHIGHSYGGVAAAYADAHGTGSGADRTVMVGAPGPGDNDRAGAFNVGGDNVYVMESPNDEIGAVAGTPVHGPAPTSDHFGANVLDGGDGNHMSYFGSGTDTVDDLGELVTDDR